MGRFVAGSDGPFPSGGQTFQDLRENLRYLVDRSTSEQVFDTLLSIGMPSALPIVESDSWQQLEVYRQRYDIEDRLGAIESLERSIHRRQARLDAARRHVDQLEAMLGESRRDLDAIRREIAESRRVGAHLIDEIIEQVRVDEGEGWTPWPVRGFRVWSIEEEGLVGAKMRWPTPRMCAVCLKGAPGDDIPHTASACGTPPCGIYAAKGLDFFDRLGSTPWLDSVGVTGVVAMAGKVVEHDDGYRCARATVEAVSVQLRDAALLTDNASLVEAVFADPVATVERHGERGWLEPSVVTAFLTRAKQKEETWT